MSNANTFIYRSPYFWTVFTKSSVNIVAFEYFCRSFAASDSIPWLIAATAANIASGSVLVRPYGVRLGSEM